MKAILIGAVLRHNVNSDELKSTMHELTSLCYTYGIEVLGSVWCSLVKYSGRYFIGEGKLQDVKLLLQDLNVDTLVFNDDLTPAQLRNIEDLTGANVLDRTMLIIDIFAKRAKSNEGKLQVELARCNYYLPRLTGKGVMMSQIAGGMRARGPGETKLETSRRRLRDRIAHLKQELKLLEKRRALSRYQREKVPLPVLSLVGYTNSGKSTLFRAFTSFEVIIENKLFSTLDPKMKRVLLPNKQIMLLTDTVGFIRKLPHHLVEAFKATFEEVKESDLLIHVIDASEDYNMQIREVGQVLDSMGIKKPMVCVFNKIDLMDDVHIKAIREEKKDMQNAVFVSALKNEGLDNLIYHIMSELREVFVTKRVTLKIPLEDREAINYLSKEGIWLNTKNNSDGTISVEVIMTEVKLAKLKKYIV